MTHNEKRLPEMLESPVIVDAIFEIRFNALPGVSDLLPGTMVNLFDQSPRVERLPLADVPIQIRNTQPGFGHQPVIRLGWDSHAITVGEQMLGIGCILPYPGWGAFRDIIFKLVNHLSLQPFVGLPNRFSVKYLDFLPSDKFLGLESILDWNVSIGGDPLESHPISLRSKRLIENLTVITEIQMPANIQVQGQIAKPGILISTDVIAADLRINSWSEFKEQFARDIDELHLQCKKQFFNCLTDAAINALGPKYPGEENVR